MPLLFRESGLAAARLAINDPVASGIAGSLLGEPLFRMASLMLECGPDGEPGFGKNWRRLIAISFPAEAGVTGPILKAGLCRQHVLGPLVLRIAQHSPAVADSFFLRAGANR